MWQEQYLELGNRSEINYVQIFENKGSVMGCSNPHLTWDKFGHNLRYPMNQAKESVRLKAYYDRHSKTLLEDYLRKELDKQERILVENDHFVALVPYWATWPFETMIISKRAIQHLGQMSEEEKEAFAAILSRLVLFYTIIYLKYLSLILQEYIKRQPMEKTIQNGIYICIFIHTLLRSATVKKFMVGYEMLGNPQRDITPETSAERLRILPKNHYKG